ncbi:G protein-coupled receptor 65 [Salminus brasiliensis]|uniref:G protein-coupled receptor 65 n=1 Tax=Salminus brasiliensis TaxID=930266 RepID=UPI003B830174
MNSTPASNTSEGECYPEMSMKYYFFTLHLVVIVIGIPSNAFSLFVSYQHIKQKNELGIYLFNLALSDLCFIIGLPVWMDFTYNDIWRYDKTICTMCVFFLFTNFYTSAVLLSCIAVDRYLAVVYPLNFSFLRTPSTAATASAAVWVLVLMFNAITISSKDIYNSDYKVCLDVFPLSNRQKMVNVARFIVGFLLPAVVVVFCHWRIYLEVRTNQAVGLPERKHVFKLLSSLLLSLCLCFGPLHITLLLRAILEKCQPPTWLYILYKTGVALSTLNCLADPLLYCFITRTGRRNAIKALLSFHK